MEDQSIRAKENTFDVLPMRNGGGAIALVEYEGVLRSNEPSRVVVHFKVRLQPKEQVSRIGVLIDDADYLMLRERLQQLGRDQHDGLEEFAAFAIARDLDTCGLPKFAPSGTPAHRVNGDGAYDNFWAQRPYEYQVSDEEIFEYIIQKIFWSWRYGVSEVWFTPNDARRLKVPSAELNRVAIAGDGKYWTTLRSGLLSYTPTGRLIQDYMGGVAPGSFRPPLVTVLSDLRAPRYESVRSQLEKAVEYSNGNVPDLSNAIKEATAAVESLTLIVLAKKSGTLGDCIKEIRSRNLIAPALIKALESLWAYSSQEPGVRHGKAEWSTPVSAEAAFAIGLAANAVSLLLQIDASRAMARE